jgi:hypothetical protein
MICVKGGHLQMRRFQIVTVIVMLICFLALLTPHAGVHGGLLACVLFFPVFLYGLLDLSQLFQNVACADEPLLSPAPVLSSLFQRPPPTIQ